jgi:multisubunit Na+/H+ antiporter MnhF subunit
LAALQLAGIVTTMAALLLAAGFHRPTVADIPMALAVLSFPSSLLFAHFLERWL